MGHPTPRCPEGFGQDAALAYLCDDEGGYERRRFAEHLESTGCEACAERLRSLTRMQEALGRSRPRANRTVDPLRAGLRSDARAAGTGASPAAAAARLRRGFVPRRAWGLGLAATVLVAVTGAALQPYLPGAARSEGAPDAPTGEPAPQATSAAEPEPAPTVVDASSRRVALVIGNSAYTHEANLRNPRNDAADMAAALRRIGFRVTLLLDVGREELTEALRAFTHRSARADIALVFYAGHGLEVDRVNYLVPVDARLEVDAHVRYEAVTLEDVLAATMGASLRLVVLDACRDNPLARSMRRTVPYRSVSDGGFADLNEDRLDDGVLVAYAAAAGTKAKDGEGENSPYTSALLAHVEQPLEILTLFRRVRAHVLDATKGEQRPYEYQSLLDEHYLVGGAAFAAVETAPPPPGAALPRLGIVELSLLAEEGHAAAQNEFGERYEHGDGGLARDYREAARWYRRAADQGYAAAQHNLGYLYGEGRVDDQEEALRLARLAADQGHADAMSAVGYHYLHGLGGADQDDEEALRWFERAAEGGSIVGQINLATMYEDGRGVPQSHAEAVRLYSLALDREDAGRAAQRARAYAHNQLGRMYEEGRGVQRELQVAAMRYQLAAELGNVDAQSNLGFLFESGRGVPLDYAEAAVWYRQGADQGDSWAQTRLGFMYENGRGVPPDHAEAARWYRRAAEAGDFLAQTSLGLLYEEGLGVTRDPAEAVRWLGAAAQQGYGRARKELRRLSEDIAGGLTAASSGRPDDSWLVAGGGIPPDGCLEQLGVLTSRTYTRQGAWDGSCVTVNYPDGEYARYYRLTLDGAATVAMDLTSSEADAWLALWTDNGGEASLVEQDDDGGEGTNARIEQELPGGTYTIEATTLVGGMTGPFTLTVTVASR